MKTAILILTALFVSCGNISAKQYLLDWYLKGTVYEGIVFDDKSSYNLIKGEGPWEDNKGYFGYLNCIGKTSDINNKSILDMVCAAYDDDGDKVVPTRIQKLKDTNKESMLLGRYLKELDRWVEVYNLSFPKLNKPATGVKLGSETFRLEIAGIEGRLEFSWEDVKKFY